MPEDVHLHYEFQSIRFATDASTNTGLALTSGSMSVAGMRGRFGLALAPQDDGAWKLRDVRCIGNFAELLHRKEVLQDLVNRAAVLLKAINMWPQGEASGDGAQLYVNELLAPRHWSSRVMISFRPDMLSLPTAQWDSLWSLIEARVRNDPYFRVHGFDADEVQRAIPVLKRIFPGSWVRKRYRRACRDGTNLKMAAQLPQDAEGWFPAAHLARTALGAICIDPGWNYLIETGLSILELKAFDGLPRLERQVSRSPGTQHHLCLAAELFRRGHLLALEPSTGAGGASNDLLVTCGDRRYEIEVKEFASANPAEKLVKEIDDKCRKLPDDLETPVVFHAVLIEQGMIKKSKEDLFFKAIQELAPNLPRKISAVVAGRRFVDSSGGRVKRDTEVRVLNPAALAPSDAGDLATLFAKNYEAIQYPLFGIGSFFNFAAENTEPAST